MKQNQNPKKVGQAQHIQIVSVKNNSSSVLFLFIFYIILGWGFIYLAFDNWDLSKIFAEEKRG